jgi:hypothetical protein
MKMQYASLGSISTGTMKYASEPILAVELVEAFADQLDHLIQCNAEEWCSDNGRKQRDEYLNLVFDGRNTDTDDEAESMLDELIAALEYFAPPYCYFGAIEGDGADYGYWPNMESIEELPNVNDSDEAKALGEDCKFVNDHGNVTVYNGNGDIVLELV